jgi:hypothetical protein
VTSNTYSLPPDHQPSRFRQRDKLRALRWRLRDTWRHLRPGSRRRELCEELIGQIDAKLGRAAK